MGLFSEIKVETLKESVSYIGGSNNDSHTGPSHPSNTGIWEALSDFSVTLGKDSPNNELVAAIGRVCAGVTNPRLHLFSPHFTMSATECNTFELRLSECACCYLHLDTTPFIVAIQNKHFVQPSSLESY